MSQKCHERPHALPALQVRASLAWRAMSRDRAGKILTPDCKDCPLSCSPEPIGHGQGTVWRRDEHVDERGNANNQKAEQKCSNKSSGSPMPLAVQIQFSIQNGSAANTSMGLCGFR